MTTGCWLLLVAVVSSQSVDSQSTIDDEVCDGGKMSKLQRDMDTLLSTIHSQQQMLQQLQTAVNRLGMLSKNL